MRVAIYLRVSTQDQSTEAQKQDLLAWVERTSYELTEVYEDHGISGAKGRDKRPALDRMMKAAVRREFDLVAVWSLDRLGRSLKDLVLLLEELRTLEIGFYSAKQGLDTSSTWGRAMLQMAGVFAEVEREMIRERVKAGMRKAKNNGKRVGRPLSLTPRTIRQIKDAKASGHSGRKIARDMGLDEKTVRRALAA